MKKDRYIEKLTIGIVILIAVACSVAGCRYVDSYDCARYAYHTHRQWFFISHDEAKFECMSSEVFGPYELASAQQRVYTLNVLGRCRFPGAYVTSEHFETGGMHYLVMCPK